MSRTYGGLGGTEIDSVFSIFLILFMDLNIILVFVAVVE